MQMQRKNFIINCKYILVKQSLKSITRLTVAIDTMTIRYMLMHIMPIYDKIIVGGLQTTSLRPFMDQNRHRQAKRSVHLAWDSGLIQTVLITNRTQGGYHYSQIHSSLSTAYKITFLIIALNDAKHTNTMLTAEQHQCQRVDNGSWFWCWWASRDYNHGSFCAIQSLINGICKIFTKHTT